MRHALVSLLLLFAGAAHAQQKTTGTDVSTEVGGMFDVYVSSGVEYTTRQPLSVFRAGLRVGPITLTGWKGRNRFYEPTVSVEHITTTVDTRLYGGQLETYVLGDVFKIGPTAGFNHSTLIAGKLDADVVDFESYFGGFGFRLKVTDYLRLTGSVAAARVHSSIRSEYREIIEKHTDVVDDLSQGNLPRDLQLRAFFGLRFSLFDTFD